MDKSNCGIDDYADIKKNFDAYRLRQDAYFNRICFNRVDGLRGITAECWCRKASPTGGDIQCPVVAMNAIC